MEVYRGQLGTRVWNSVEKPEQKLEAHGFSVRVGN